MAKLTLHIDESALNAVSYIADLTGETVEQFVKRCALDPMVSTCLDALHNNRLGLPVTSSFKKKSIDA